MNNGVRLEWTEIRGFRAFGTEPRRLSLGEPLIVVHAGNSQGKTSFAEALEFLLSGHCSRRELLGGAKAEYHGSLRNAHMPDGDHEVYIAAGVRGPDGTLHEIRRELIRDFGSGSECESRLIVDGVSCSDLSALGLPLGDPPVRAPVLLQHTLRHVLSTEPKQRVGYFKALLSVNDLDVLRKQVAAARGVLDGRSRGDTLRSADRLAGTPAVTAAKALNALAESKYDRRHITASVEKILTDAGAALLGERSESVAHLKLALEAAIKSSHEAAFPLAAFSSSDMPAHAAAAPNLTLYSAALAQTDREAARLTPLLNAVLAIDEYTDLDHSVDCPVCATTKALTPTRISELRDRLARTATTDTAFSNAIRFVESAQRELDSLVETLSGVIPIAASWRDEEAHATREQLRQLGLDQSLSDRTFSTASRIAKAMADIDMATRDVRTALAEVHYAVTARETLPTGIVNAYTTLGTALRNLDTTHQAHRDHVTVLRAAVEPALSQRGTGAGVTVLLQLVTNISQLVNDLVQESGRRQTIKRIANAEKSLSAAAGRVLDARFGQMSDTIAKWWGTVRPEERVGFAGMRRRAGGAVFLNLVAALRSNPNGEPVERDALGVYSDSQLNALGLSIFLARAELLGTPFVLLDDPIPGSDSDHRLTFIQNTLSGLLDAGIQVILTTFDSKLAEWTQANHDHRGLIGYELALVDPMVGTEAIQTTDVFNRYMLEAEDNLNAPTARGRRAACGSFRSAAERLAKQIIATGRTNEGHPCTVPDIHQQASMLGDLVPIVCGYALGNDEKGQWRTFARVLNPGNHDDDVPSTPELRQVRGNLRKIAKEHNKHWPDGLLI